MIHPFATVGSMSKPTYRSNSNMVYSAKYDLLFCYGSTTAGCSPSLWRLDLPGSSKRSALRTKSRYSGLIMLDHVHQLVEVDVSFGMSRLIRFLKGHSSRVLYQEAPTLRSRLPSLWTNSYFVSTVGGVPLSVTNAYVENEKAA